VVRFPAGKGIFPFATEFRSAVGPTEHPIQRVSMTLSQGHQAESSTSSNPSLRMRGAIPPLPLRLRGMLLNYGEECVFNVWHQSRFQLHDRGPLLIIIPRYFQLLQTRRFTINSIHLITSHFIYLRFILIVSSNCTQVSKVVPTYNFPNQDSNNTFGPYAFYANRPSWTSLFNYTWTVRNMKRLVMPFPSSSWTHCSHGEALSFISV
jgi:hypothetical protein